MKKRMHRTSDAKLTDILQELQRKRRRGKVGRQNMKFAEDLAGSISGATANTPNSFVNKPARATNTMRLRDYEAQRRIMT